MNKIMILVITNEDRIKNVLWPANIDIRPMIGEYIESLDRKHRRKIVEITHCYSYSRSYLEIVLETLFPLG